MKRQVFAALCACAFAIPTSLCTGQEPLGVARAAEGLPGGDSSTEPPDQSEETDAASRGPLPIYEPMRVGDLLGTDAEHPTVQLTGFFQLDAGWFAQDEANRATVEDIQDGVDFRRARLAGKGNLTKDISYILELDFAASQAQFVDVSVNFAEVPGLGNLRIGRWRQPFGMSALTSIRELPFLERATPFAFVPFRQTGIGAYNTALDNRLAWAISAYRYPSEGFGNNVGDNGGWGTAGRLTMLPRFEDEGERLIHLGVDFSFDDPSNDQLRFQNTPEVFVGENAGSPVLPDTPAFIPPFVDTGILSAKNLNLFGVEAAGKWGPLVLQSEAYWAVVKLLEGGTETLPGAYVQARWILTGEQSPYDRKSGVFGRVVPDRNASFATGGIGARELAARCSYINLNGSGFPGPGRQLNDLTLGLNWYLSLHTKFQLNYIHAFLQDPLLDESDADIVALRAQIDF